MVISKITDMARLILSELIAEGDVVVDATLGNGNDAAFLRKLVGATGYVYAMDIQPEAIKKSKELIPAQQQSNMEFIADGHENLDKYIDESVKAVVFNLGYLPQSSHEIKTSWQTTQQAIQKALHMLDMLGLICVSAYLGHDDGAEYQALHTFFANLDAKKYKVIEINPINQNKHAPKLLICQRLA